VEQPGQNDQAVFFIWTLANWPFYSSQPPCLLARALISNLGELGIFYHRPMPRANPTRPQRGLRLGRRPPHPRPCADTLGWRTNDFSSSKKRSRFD